MIARQLNERGFGDDIKLAVDEHCSDTVPMFTGGEYVDHNIRDALPK